MNPRFGRLLAIAAFVCCGLASAQTLAQNAYITNAGDNTVSVIATATNTVTATIAVGGGPVAFGIFIQSHSQPRFAGTPGFSNCRGVSVSALSIEFGDNLGAAATALGFRNVPALQAAITAFCHG